MKLSNTHKHLRLSFVCGFPMMIALFWISLPAKLIVGWSAIVVWFCGTIAWEAWQWVKYGQKRNYWEFRGWDTVCDLLAGNLPFWVMTLAGMYGHYAGQVLR